MANSVQLAISCMKTKFVTDIINITKTELRCNRKQKRFEEPELSCRMSFYSAANAIEWFFMAG